MYIIEYSFEMFLSTHADKVKKHELENFVRSYELLDTRLAHNRGFDVLIRLHGLQR